MVIYLTNPKLYCERSRLVFSDDDHMTIRGGIQKKKLVFFGVYPKGGGVSPNPKFPNQKMIEIFLDFFAERGGGLTQSKISVIRNCLFFFGNGGGSFPIQNFLIRKN